MSAVSETEMVSGHVIIYLFYYCPRRMKKSGLEAANSEWDLRAFILNYNLPSKISQLSVAMNNFVFQSADSDGTKHTRYQFQKKNFPPDFKSWQPTTPFSVSFHRRLLNQACAQHNPQGGVGVEGVGVLMPRTTEMIFNPKISRIPGIFSPSKNQASFVFLLHFAPLLEYFAASWNNSEKYFWLVKIELQWADCILTRASWCYLQMYFKQAARTCHNWPNLGTTA